MPSYPLDVSTVDTNKNTPCYDFQASIQKNVPIYKAAVKTNLEVRIDQDNFLAPDMWAPSR